MAMNEKYNSTEPTDEVRLPCISVRSSALWTTKLSEGSPCGLSTQRHNQPQVALFCLVDCASSQSRPPFLSQIAHHSPDCPHGSAFAVTMGIKQVRSILLLTITCRTDSFLCFPSSISILNHVFRVSLVAVPFVSLD
jgi:hypothetical protein